MPSGGKRRNAGRPKGTGLYAEPTKVVRIPVSLADKIKDFNQNEQPYSLPLFGSKVSAGFPSPADDYQENKLNLNEYLIHHPSSTFFVRVSGDSMLNAGIHPNDLLIVDRSLSAVSGKIVIAIVEGEFTVKRYVKKQDKIFLMPENPKYSPIEIKEKDEAQIWGVVTSVIHQV